MGKIRKAQIKRLARVCLKPLLRKEDGAAAVEFAIIAPILAAATIGMIDVSMLLYERSDVGNALRMAAQTAMSDPGIKRVSATLDTFKSQKQFSSSINFEYQTMRFCACPDLSQDLPMAQVSCEKRCPSSKSSPSVFYKITSGTKYDGIILKGYRISNEIEVQVE